MSHWSSWMLMMSDVSIWWNVFLNRIWQLWARLSMSVTLTRYEASTLLVHPMSNHRNPTSVPIRITFPYFRKNISVLANCTIIQQRDILPRRWLLIKRIVSSPDITKSTFTLLLNSLQRMTCTNFIPIIPLWDPVYIRPSRDDRHGFSTQTGFPLFDAISCHPFMRAPHCECKLNLLFVDNVAKDIIKGAS